jgi:hypothetical protein
MPQKPVNIDLNNFLIQAAFGFYVHRSSDVLLQAIADFCGQTGLIHTISLRKTLKPKCRKGSRRVRIGRFDATHLLPNCTEYAVAKL